MSERTISDFCKRHGLTEEQFHGTGKYVGDLDLSSLTAIPEGFNPTVGGSLDLSSLTAIPEGFNPTVGGYLYLRSYKGPKPAIKKPQGPIGPIYPMISPSGKHIFADGILQHLISKKGLVYRVKYLTRSDITYLVTDGHGRFAHGDTLKDARDSLVYKIGDRDKSKFQGMTRETVLTFAEAVEAYRVITGACAAGTRNFVESKIGRPKAKYTIGKIVKLTDGQYGHAEFAAFFSTKE